MRKYSCTDTEGREVVSRDIQRENSNNKHNTRRKGAKQANEKTASRSRGGHGLLVGQVPTLPSFFFSSPLLSGLSLAGKSGTDTAGAGIGVAVSRCRVEQERMC